MTGSEICALMEGIAKARVADDGDGRRDATVAIAPLVAQMKARMRCAVHAHVHRARQASGNDNT